MAPPTQVTPTSLRTPGAAGFAGIAFALLFGLALTLLHASAPASPSDAGTWLTDSTRRSSANLALNLVPFAGIAFLWFMGAIRSRIGAVEDKFFATLYLGSGLIFVTMLFAVAALAGGLISAAAAHQGAPDPDLWQFGRHVTFSLVTTYAMRMAGVFVITTSIVGLRLQFLPQWLARVGYVAAILLLFVSGTVPWIELTFPVWVLVVSVHLLRVPTDSGSHPAAAIQADE